MGIVLHDINEDTLDMDIPGTQTQTADQAACIVKFPGVIRGILARLDTAPSAAGVQVTDVKLNGVSIFSGGTKINFATGATVPTYGAFTTNPTKVAKGDTITLHNSSVTGTAGKNFAMTITIRRSRASVLGTDTDSVSASSDAI